MAGQAIDLSYAKTRLEELVERAAHGEEIVLTKSGRPVARIVSVSPAKTQRQFGSAKGLIVIPPDFDEALEGFGE